MRVILFLGGVRCGKDGHTEQLVKQLKLMEYDVYETAFAKKVKQHISKTLGIDIDTLDKLKNSKAKLRFRGNEISVRKFIINFAETAKELYGKDFWVREVYKEIKENRDKDFIIISDLGFMEEYNFLRDKILRRNMFIVKLKSNLPDCDLSNKKEAYENIRPDIIINNEFYKNKTKQEELVLDNISIIVNRVLNF